VLPSREGDTVTRRLAALALLTVTGLGLGLTACGDDDGGSSSSAAVTVTDAWARTSPAMATVGAAYMTLESADGDSLVAASVDPSVAAKVEIHETTMAETSDTTMAMGGSDTTAMGMGSDTTAAGSGAMTMQPVDSVPLPAGEPVSFAPGGYHLMLLDLAEPLTVGETIEITLTFEKAGTQTVAAEVRDTAP
jgi:periplasmic copper chaperone A